MSATPTPNVERAKAHCHPEDVTPVTIDARALDSTAPEYLRDLKRELTDEGLYPAGVRIQAGFDEACSLATQEEADRIRGLVRAASFLGAGSVTVSVDAVHDEDRVRPALAACAERAEREGLSFDLDAPVALAD